LEQPRQCVAAVGSITNEFIIFSAQINSEDGVSMDEETRRLIQ
jgi:hypothetical protein